MLNHVWRTLLLLALIQPGWAAQADDGPWRASQTARVTVGADGRVLEARLYRSTLSEAMQEELAQRIHRFEFEPAIKDGQPVTSVTHIALRLVVEPSGERLAIKVAGAASTVGIAKLIPPRFPRTQLTRSKGAVVDVRITYDADGNVTAAEVAHAEPDLKVFREATLKAAREWQIHPEQIDGQPIAGSALIPISFEMAKHAEVKFPDGGHLSVSRTPHREVEQLSGATRLRSIGADESASRTLKASAG